MDGCTGGLEEDRNTNSQINLLLKRSGGGTTPRIDSLQETGAV